MNPKHSCLPLVSIIIPVYNGAKYLREAIDSALAQTYPNIEVLVINDGSRDEGETHQIAISYGKSIRYYKKQNGGAASALNLGISQMQGEYFAWLSHDDLYLPSKIEKQVDFLLSHKKPQALVFSGFVVVDASGHEIHRVMPIHKYNKEQLSKPLFALLHGQINGCALLVHKSHFERVGVFREDLRTTHDYELWFRMMREETCYCYEEALSISRIHDEQTGQRYKEEHIRESDNLWIHMMETLSDQEKIALNGSLNAFYKQVYLLLSTYTSNVEAMKHAKNNMNGYQKMVLQIERFFVLLRETVYSCKQYGLQATFNRVKRGLQRII